MILADAAAKYRAELRLVVRASAAAALALLIAETLALPQGYWAVISALMIVQGSLGGTLSAGIDRLVGTLAGAAFGAVAALAREVWDVPHVVLLVLAVAPLALLAALRPNFRVAPVTAAIVLLASSGTVSPLASALTRVAEITLGTFVGIAVSLFVLPSRARALCFERAAALLTDLAALLAVLLQPPDPARQATIDGLNERIRNGLIGVADAAQEASHEHATRLAGELVPERLVRLLRRLRIDVVFVGRATAADLDWPRLGPALAALAAGFDAELATLAATLRRDDPAAAHDFTALDAAIAGLHRTIEAGADDPAVSKTMAVVPFVIDTLRRDLADLVDALARPGAS
jgi:uncharacterized membrane protein YccC